MLAAMTETHEILTTSDVSHYNYSTKCALFKIETILNLHKFVTQMGSENGSTEHV